MTDHTAYVQDFIDRGEKIPAGEYRCADGVSIPHDYVDRARLAGRDDDLPPDYFALGEMGGVTIEGATGCKVWLGNVRRAPGPGSEEPVVICRDDMALFLPVQGSLILNDVSYQVPGGSPGGFVRD